MLVIITDYVKHQLEFENESIIHIPFSTLSEDRNNGRYTDLSSVRS